MDIFNTIQQVIRQNGKPAERVSVPQEAERRDADAGKADRRQRRDRPWGYCESLATGPSFHVRHIVVNPGGRLSLQSHMYRSEHWVVVRGTATVTVGRKRREIGENGSICIQRGEVHRLENFSGGAIELIEVQYGTYFGDDDIERYEDCYGRGQLN